MSDESTRPLSNVGQEVVKTIGPQLNTYTPVQSAGILIEAPNFVDTSPEDATVREIQIMNFTETFDIDIRSQAPDWVDMDKFIVVTSGFAANSRFWNKIFGLSPRHHRYLRGELTIPKGQEGNYEEAHSPERIAENNSSLFGYSVMLLAAAALYGNTMDTIPITPSRKNNARLKAALRVSREFEGIASTPDSFIHRLIRAFEELGYDALQEEDAFRVKARGLGLSVDDNGLATLGMVNVNRLCPFEGQASKHFLMGIALAFRDYTFVEDYLTHIKKNTL